MATCERMGLGRSGPKTVLLFLVFSKISYVGNPSSLVPLDSLPRSLPLCAVSSATK